MSKKSMTIEVVLVAVVLIPTIAAADIMEVGDLNIIDQAGNASDGLRYLDMSYSDGLTMADALANARATYANARLATASEFDDLFAASTLTYDGSLKLSDAFLPGEFAWLSSQSNYDTSLRDILGVTNLDGTIAYLYTDPDGTSHSSSTLDVLGLSEWGVFMNHQRGTPPHPSIGWLIVSGPAVVPLPGATILGFLGLGTASMKLRRRRST